MQIVIDIPEEVYKSLNKNSWNSCFVNDELTILEQALCNGTPLPKGHGRLIDADSIYQIVRPIEQSDAEWGMTAETAIRLMHDVFNKAPTIIEADKDDE